VKPDPNDPHALALSMRNWVLRVYDSEGKVAAETPGPEMWIILGRYLVPAPPRRGVNEEMAYCSSCSRHVSVEENGEAVDHKPPRFIPEPDADELKLLKKKERKRILREYEEALERPCFGVGKPTVTKFEVMVARSADLVRARLEDPDGKADGIDLPFGLPVCMTTADSLAITMHLELPGRGDGTSASRIHLPKGPKPWSRLMAGKVFRGSE